MSPFCWSSKILGGGEKHKRARRYKCKVISQNLFILIPALLELVDGLYRHEKRRQVYETQPDNAAAETAAAATLRTI